MAAAPPPAPGTVIVLDDEDEGTPPPPSTPPGPSGTPPGTPPSGGGGGGGKGGGFKVENERLFAEFLDLCTLLTEEHPEVVPFLCSRHRKATLSFRNSAEFHNILSRCLGRVRSRRHKVYVYINELCTALKAHTLRRKLPLIPVSQPAPHPDAIPDGVPDDPTSSSSIPSGSKRQIRYLENLLRVYAGEIRRLQERELDLEELDSRDSAYLQESRLKRRLMRIFSRLCQLKRCSGLTGRVMEQRIPYRGTRYPEVNRRVERFINRPDVFPDYGDVLKVIQKANGRHRLGLARKHMENMAQDAFREVGNRLQERRHLDLVYNFGSHLTDQYRPGTDPALGDPELAKRLRRNRTLALSRLDQVISHYAQLQDESEEEERGRKRRRSTPGMSQQREEEEEEEETEEETEEEEEEEGDSSDGSHGKRQEEEEGNPLELRVSHGKSDEDEEGATSELNVPYGRAKGEEGNPLELRVSHGKGDEDEEGATSELSVPYGRAKEEEEDGANGTHGQATHGQAKQEEAPIAPPPGAAPMEAMPKAPEEPKEPELFMLEIETLPMEPNETPPGSPPITGGSEANPKGVSPSTPPSRLPPPHSQPFRVPLFPHPPGKRGFPLENGGGGAAISSTSCNGSAEEGGDPPVPPHKRSRRELSGGGSPCIEVHSVGSEDEDEEGPAGGGARHSPLPDSTRADSPGGDLVSSTQGSPCLRHPKACKMSVATQCDPEEIIVLSDSD